MANPNVVITDSTAETPQLGKVFDGVSFFLVQRIPLRSRFVNDITANGGHVVKLESQADYVIADHLRNDAPAGSYSYEFIDAAIQNGQLPDPADHAIRPPGAVREAGSTARGKTTRTPYTIEEDKFLWNWVEQAKARGDYVKGQLVYKGLEAVNPRHTWQSWRDRYIKQLSVRPPMGVTVHANPPPSPPVEAPENPEVGPAEEAKKEFDDEDFEMLRTNAGDIELIEDHTWEEAWKAFAKAQSKSGHSAEEWSTFYKLRVRPVYLEELAEAGEVDAAENNDEAHDHQETASPTKKRKQGNVETSMDMDMVQNKRQRTSSPEADGFAEQSKKQAFDSDGNLPTVGEFEEHTTEQDLQDLRPVESIITSEVTTAANLQLQQEAGVNPMDLVQQPQSSAPQLNASHDMPSETELPTSDANRAAEAQFGDWRARVVDVDEEESAAENIQVLPSDNGAIPQTFNISHGALTAANLASQQALYEPPEPRGKDIPRDRADEDQTGYLEYLQRIVRPGIGEAPRLVPNDKGDETSEGDPERYESAQSRTEQADANTYIPLSSPGEIADVLDDVLDWPRSPQQRKKQRAEPDVSYQQQPLYPTLPSQDRDDDASRRESDFEVRALISQLDDDATSSQRRGSESQTQDTGELVLPNFDELVARDHLDPDSGVDKSQPEDLDGLDDDYGEQGDHSDDVDLTIPEPDGGFDFPYSPYEDGDHLEPGPDESAGSQAHNVVSISSHQSSTSLSGDYVESQTKPQPRHTNNGRRGHAVETQDILDTETQQPDFDFPPPIDSDDEIDEHPMDRSQQKPSTQKGEDEVFESRSLDSPEEVKAWVSTMVVRGYKQAAIIKALKCTSMRPDLALLVLIEEKARKGLPDDVPGVWSEIEDAQLEGGDAKWLKQLSKKHSWTEMESRMKFLEGWRGLS